jgi:hypothetical protein
MKKISVALRSGCRDFSFVAETGMLHMAANNLSLPIPKKCDSLIMGGLWTVMDLTDGLTYGFEIQVFTAMKIQVAVAWVVMIPTFRRTVLRSW